MIPRLLQNLTLFGTLLLTGLMPHHRASGGVFDQQEFDQNQFIAIARPYGGNKYDLLVLQQIPGQRQCWSESGSNPILVEPLLLDFDFSGNCERSTDSNGYSVRLDGQDYGLDYLLRIVERNGELVLVATNRLKPSQPELIVGRTYGIQPGFLKIVLTPGWRFSKRAFQGKVLGHVYLTGDTQAIQPPQELIATRSQPTIRETPVTPPQTTPSKEPRELTFTAPENPTPASVPDIPTTDDTVENASSSPTDTNPVPPSPPPQKTSTLPPLPPPPTTDSPVVLPPPTTSSDTGRKTLADVLVVNPRQASNNSSSPPPPPLSTNYRVMVEAKTSTEQAQVRSHYPDAFPNNYNGRSLWQIGVFSSRENAEVALQSLTDLGLSGVIVPK